MLSSIFGSKLVYGNPTCFSRWSVRENGKKYVEMSYTWENMTPGANTASEVKTSRYSLKNVINVKKGVYDSNGKVVNFTIRSNEEGKATFYNVKNTYKDLSHNSIAVNTFKK